MLAQIDPRPYQARLEQAQAQLGRDQAQLANAAGQPRPQPAAAQQRLRHRPAGHRSALRSRAAAERGQVRPGGDRRRADPAQLHDADRPVRRRHRRATARRRQHHPPDRRQRPGRRDPGAADQRAVHPAGGRHPGQVQDGAGARHGRGGRLRPDRHDGARHRTAAAGQQPGRSAIPAPCSSRRCSRTCSAASGRAPSSTSS